MPIISTTRMTAEQFLQLGEDPPGVRLELVDGEVAVSPSPTPGHSTASIKLAVILENYNEAHDLGELLLDVDTRLDQFNVRRPDILFLFHRRAHLIGKKVIEGPPDLAVEVISPSSVEVDREDKFAQYRDAGVANYWIIDPLQRTAEAFRLEGKDYVPCGSGRDEEIVRFPPFPDLEIPLKKLWRRPLSND